MVFKGIARSTNGQYRSTRNAEAVGCYSVKPVLYMEAFLVLVCDLQKRVILVLGIVNISCVHMATLNISQTLYVGAH